MALFKVLLAVQLASFLFCVSVDSASVLPPKPNPTLPPKASPFWQRKLVAVQGVVYCRSCKYLLFETLMDAKPLPGAFVKLQCNNTKTPITVKTTTDKNGYFYVQAPKTVSTHGAHKCRVFLDSSPNSSCKVATDLHGGVKGAYLRFEPKQPAQPSSYTLFTVGPLAFSPDRKTCKW